MDVMKGHGNAVATPPSMREAWLAAKVAPLWENPMAHGGKQRTEVPQLWPWQTMKPLIEAALELTSPEAVERRVLQLLGEHPRFDGLTTTTVNLNAALQILKPGESARPHRHSMAALRFVLDGRGATTIVDGKHCPMAEGDMILTPSWTWHEHVHAGEGPIVWLDVLDAILHRYLGTDKFEPGPTHDVPERLDDDAYASAAIIPVGESFGSSPLFRYPMATAMAAVRAAKPGPDGARRARYVDPTTGGPVMPLIDCYLVEIDARTQTIPLRTSSHAICAVVSGSGSTHVGDDAVEWGPKDIFTLPANGWIQHRVAGETARLFVTTDREVMRRLDLLTEEYGG